MGMGRRHNTNTVPITIHGQRPTRSARSKFDIFYTNINSLNIHEYKTKINKMENRLNSCRLRHYTEQSFGAKISVGLDTNKLKIYFGIFLAIIAVVETITLFKQNKNENKYTFKIKN